MGEGYLGNLEMLRPNRTLADNQGKKATSAREIFKRKKKTKEN